MHIPPGPPLALTTDGVGTKILLAREANRWEPVGIDCVANNVNDVICVGAVPLALLDYIATDRIDEDVLEAVARGLYQGADEAGIAIPGGEIAQIGAMLAPLRGRPAHAGPGRHRGRRAPRRAQPGGRVAGPPGRRHPGAAQLGPAQQRLLAGPPGAGLAALDSRCPAPASASTTRCSRRPGCTCAPPRRCGRRG